MALFIFKYALPALLAYTLFVGIAGRYNPFQKPTYLEERPYWFLGLWTAGCIFLVLMVGFQMAYGLPVETGRAIAMPAALGLAALLGCGLGIFYLYRDKVHAEIDEMEQRAKNREDVLIDWESKVSQLDSILDSNDQIPDNLATTLTYQELSEELSLERKLRVETERHLRITRKALATAAAATKINNVSTGSTLLGQTTPNISAEHTIHRDESERVKALEKSVAELRRDLVAAKQDIRVHVAARAKALSTANKSVAFARQSIEIRARLETELKSARSAIVARQTTISTLINKLERERRLTEEELMALRNIPVMNDPVGQASAKASVDAPSTFKTKNISGI